VNWWTGKQDRKQVALPTLKLAEERFEHEKSQEQRAEEQAAYNEINEALSDCFDYLNGDFQTDGPAEIQQAERRLVGQLSRVFGKVDLVADRWVMYYARDAGNVMRVAMQVEFEGGDAEPLVERMSRAVVAMNHFAREAVNGKHYSY
jgi:hypothetical protein